MIYTIIVEPEALQDFQNIYNYISSEDSPNKAKIFILELQKNINSLNYMPMRCRKSLYVNDENTRDLIYKKYTIAFKVIETRIHILTLFRQRAF